MLAKGALDAPLLGGFRWSLAEAHLTAIGGSTGFAEYIKGAVAVHLVKRALSFWKDARQSIANESLEVQRVRTFLREELVPGLDDEKTIKLARAVIEAEAASNRKIGKETRRALIGTAQFHTCYLCGEQLDPKTTDDQASSFFTAEHLWPCSLGGDSIIDNLLPACIKCQKAKANSMAWEWLNVHNYVLPPDPGSEDLKSIPRSARVARHYLYTLSICEKKRLSLKEGFLLVGAMNDPLRHRGADLPVTFFDLLTERT